MILDIPKRNINITNGVIRSKIGLIADFRPPSSDIISLYAIYL